MKAVHLEAFGSTDNFRVIDTEVPTIQPHEVLVSVKAFGINPVETVIRAGFAFTEAFENLEPRVLGWDITGEVVEVGSQAKEFKPGDPVFGMIRFPEPAMGYAAYNAAPCEHLARIPENINWGEAAGATLAALTAWQGLVHNGQMAFGEKVLILGAGGGVGHYAVQMAKNQGAYVAGTASSEKGPFLYELGADHHVDYKTQNAEEVIKDADLVLDGVGGQHTYRALEALRPGGRIISLAPNATDLPEKARQRGKNGLGMMVQPSGRDMQEIARQMKENRLRTHLDQIYPMEAIDKAHAHIERGKTRGKVVVKVD